MRQLPTRQFGYSLVEVSLGAAVAVVIAGSLLVSFGKALTQADQTAQAASMVAQAEAAYTANLSQLPQRTPHVPASCLSVEAASPGC